MKRDGSYRYLKNVNRLVSKFPAAHLSDPDERVTVWCSTDYLGMTANRKVIDSMHTVLDIYGTGSGGSRTISGNHEQLCSLERECARLHAKPAALLFSSGFVANDAALTVIASKMMTGCIIFSDAQNHSSIIAGIQNSGAKKVVPGITIGKTSRQSWQSLPPQPRRLLLLSPSTRSVGRSHPSSKYAG